MFGETEVGMQGEQSNSGLERDLPKTADQRQRCNPDKSEQNYQQSCRDKVERLEHKPREGAVHGDDAAAVPAETAAVGEPRRLLRGYEWSAVIKTL
jgi:hypothetical protein